MSWKEYYSYTAEFLPITGGAGTIFTDVEVRMDTDANFEFNKTIYQPTTGRVRLRYRDDTAGRYLQKGSQDCRAIAGTSLYSMAPGGPTPPGFLPFIWSDPYYISAATTLTVQGAEFSGLSYNFRLTFHGAKIREGKAPWDKKFRAIAPYIYPINTSGTVSVAANSTISASIATDNDAPFLCKGLVGARTGACLITIKDGARDRQWMNTAVHFDNLVGNAHYPHKLSAPRYVARGAVLAVTIQDLSGAANTVELNFLGVKLYE